MQPANYRNLDEIREEDGRSNGSRWIAMALFAVAGTAIAVATIVGTRRPGPAQQSQVDPLAELAGKARARATSEKPENNIGFPAVLSDQQKPTTALAAVKDEDGRLIAAPAPAASVSAPPLSATITGTPIAAGDLLRATNVTNQPHDELTRLAVAAAKPAADGELAPEGREGGFQIQVASFRSAEDADAFVLDLRRRNHKAYRQAAYVPDRGLWHRVRIGPFKTKYEAVNYRNQLERAERIAGFVIDPDRQKKADADRESGLSNRERKRAEKAGT
ncbi:MAG: SPOR domain-containing protein [Myxococcales bacterium]